MIELSNIKYVFLFGIGGIGMSSLARYFAFLGREVAGYDKTPTALTQKLQEEGIKITFDDALVAEHYRIAEEKEQVLVVYTPSVPLSLPSIAYLQAAGVELYKRSEVLGAICKGRAVVAVAGTHGKTTTSTLTAHLMKTGGIEITAFLGGISTNYKTNFIAGKSNWLVVEADEYDRSFLTLYPTAAVITAMDSDHMDVYGTWEEMERAYGAFAQQISSTGLLLVKQGLKVGRAPITYTASTALADIFAENISVEDGYYYFDYISDRLQMRRLKLSLPGTHNVENAVAAIALASYAGVAEAAIRQGLDSFKGVKRRFERVAQSAYLTLIDDYAHHPAELEATISTARALFPQSKLTVIFQPHLYSRTKDYYQEMAFSLSRADRVMLLPVYAAREEPLIGVSSALILNRLTCPEKALVYEKKLVPQILKATLDFTGRNEVVLLAGAGDIDELVEPLKAIIDLPQ